MEQKDIMHLANLARIKISPEEAVSLSKDIEAVLAYVSTINNITADVSLTKKVGARFNVFRDDEVTNDADEFTQALLREAPKTEGRYLKVKKILQTD